MKFDIIFRNYVEKIECRFASSFWGFYECFAVPWTQAEYQNKHYNVDQKDEGT